MAGSSSTTTSPTSRSGGLPVATTTCDRRWCGVAEERGWAVLTVGLDSPPPPSETEEFVAYLSQLDRLHMGVVQLVAVD